MLKRIKRFIYEPIKWRYQTHNPNIRLISIEEDVKNILKSHNIYTSSILMYEYPQLLVLRMNIFIKRKYQYRELKLLIKLIKSLITLKYNKNVKIGLKLIDNYESDNEILLSIINKRVSKNPHKIIEILKKIYKDIEV